MFFRYNRCVFMNPTYKTFKLVFLLFSLCVRTNIAHACVVSFIIQTEDSKSIAEALDLIKATILKHNIHIQSFMMKRVQPKWRQLGWYLQVTFKKISVPYYIFHCSQVPENMSFRCRHLFVIPTTCNGGVNGKEPPQIALHSRNQCCCDTHDK